jgi:hypothetical protein
VAGDATGATAFTTTDAGQTWVASAVQ